MTRKLEQLFDLPDSDSTDQESQPLTKQTLFEIDATIDKIDAALPSVKGLDASDAEMDDLAAKATESYENLMDLGMQVDSRFASEIFAVAGAMLGHAITAKTAKLNKKLKMVDLQLKKLRLDQTVDNQPKLPNGEGRVLDRNDLLKTLSIKQQDQSNNLKS